MRFQTIGNKPAFQSDNVRNSETVTIPRGTPVILAFNGTEDGFAVVLPSTAGAALSAAFYFGVATDDILAGQVGEARRDGLCNYCLISQSTRTASTNSFSTQNSLNSGVLLAIDTVYNAFSTVASTINVPSTTSTVINLIDGYVAILAQIIPSVTAGSASSTASTQLMNAIGAKAMLRML